MNIFERIAEWWAEPVVQQWFWKILTVVLLIAAMFIVAGIVKKIFSRMMKRPNVTNAKRTYYSMARSLCVAAVYVVFVAVMISQFENLRNLSISLLAGSGIAVLGVTLAAQDLLSNIVGGLSISVSQPFKVGDTVKYFSTGTVGVVESINLRHTTIKTFDNRRVVIPNSVVNSDVVENYSANEDEFSGLFTEFGIAYSADAEKAMEIIIAEVRKHPAFVDRRTEEEKKAGIEDVKVRVVGWKDSSVTLKLWLWAKDFPTVCAMQQDLLLSVKNEFSKQGIEIPYQYINVINKTEGK